MRAHNIFLYRSEHAYINETSRFCGILVSLILSAAHMAEAAEEKLSELLQSEMKKLEKDCMRTLLASQDEETVTLQLYIILSLLLGGSV